MLEKAEGHVFYYIKSSRKEVREKGGLYHGPHVFACLAVVLRIY
jgi:hypothetical protein